MIEVEFSYPTFDFQVNEYTNTIKRHLERFMRQVSRVFVREAILSVPVDTGMARGSFLNVSRLVKNLALNINPHPRNDAYYYYGRDGTKVPKTPEAGAALSTPQPEIFTVEGKTYFFNYGTRVWHYNINEFFGGRSPTSPWFSYSKGEGAALTYIRNNLASRFPNFREFIIVTKVTINHKGGRREQKFRLKEKSTELEEI